jgi:hypothetical protein
MSYLRYLSVVVKHQSNKQQITLIFFSIYKAYYISNQKQKKGDIFKFFKDEVNNVFDTNMKPANPKKTTDMPQVTDKLYHIILYRVHLSLVEIQTHNINGIRH